ncbi:MAG: hypothetical protein IKB02_05700 [Clostridia bacterium]|nr:hypothetical protein [Clostridia bacterium]
MTNFERIKGMSVEELAEILDVITKADVCLNPNASCDECMFARYCEIGIGQAKKWLEMEAEE